MDKNKLVEVYMAVFHNFAVETHEVMDVMNMTRKEALKHLDCLAKKGLIVGEFHDGNGGFGYHRQEVAGIDKMWQCWNTYDTDSEEQALARVKTAV